MTKDEAIQAMHNGHKVSHRYFTDDEWMKIRADGYFEFEDGVRVSPVEFFGIRNSDAWNDGWEIYNQTKKEVTD